MTWRPLLLLLPSVGSPVLGQDCLTVRREHAQKVLNHFRLSLKNAGSIDAHVAAAFRTFAGTCDGSRQADEVMSASRGFLRSLGPLGRRESGPWCSHSFDLEWWEVRNLTGAMFRPWPYHLLFKRGLQQSIRAMRDCGLEGRFFPSEGTLIALVRYGKLAFDIGGAVDHVDKDIDMKIFVRSQEDFLQKYLCISSSLQKLKWTCTAPSYIVEDAGEPWFFECSLARTDGGVETFGSAVELHVGRFFVAGDSIRMARNCTAQFCKQYSRELGSVKDLWMPPIKCRAYDTDIPCPKSPTAVMQRSKEHTDSFKSHVALPAVAMERCSYHPGSVRLVQRGLSRRQMYHLREQARLLHFGGFASFYDFWFAAGQPKPLPLGPVSADMRPGNIQRYRNRPALQDPVQTFLTRFRGFIQVFAFATMVPPDGRDEPFASATAHSSGVSGGASVEWILYHKPVVRHAAETILQLASSPLHLAALWELKPLELCMAYFADVILRCGKPDVDRHGYVEGLCKSWARHEVDSLSNSSQGRERSFLQLLWLLASRCQKIPTKRPLGPIKPGPLFDPWFESLRSALRSFQVPPEELRGLDAALQGHMFMPAGAIPQIPMPQAVPPLERALLMNTSRLR